MVALSTFTPTPVAVTDTGAIVSDAVVSDRTAATPLVDVKPFPTIPATKSKMDSFLVLLEAFASIIAIESAATSTVAAVSSVRETSKFPDPSCTRPTPATAVASIAPVIESSPIPPAARATQAVPLQSLRSFVEVL